MRRSPDVPRLLLTCLLTTALAVTGVVGLAGGMAGASADTAEHLTQLGPATMVERGADGQLTLLFLSAGDGSLLEPSPGSGVLEPAPSGVVPQPEGRGVTRIGLLVTAEELLIWRTRWGTGAGNDSFLNARISEEKARITNNKNTFMSNPNSHLWGYDLTGWIDAEGYAQQGFENTPQIAAARNASARVRDAVFWALVNHQDSSTAGVFDAVKAVLVAQPDQRNVNNFGQQKPWGPDGAGARNSAAPHFAVSHAMVTTLLTYDYIQAAVRLGLTADLTSAQHEKLRTWFKQWAAIQLPAVDRHVESVFTDRYKGDYTPKGSYADPNWTWGDLYREPGASTHPRSSRGSQVFNNRRASQIRYIGLYGLLARDQFYIDRAKLWSRETIMHALYPHGVHFDMTRGWKSTQNHVFSEAGTHYSLMAYAHLTTFIDALARTGDTSVYDYTTTQGLHDAAGAPPAAYGGTKSYRFFAESYARYANQTFNRYGHDSQFTDDWRYDMRQPNRGLHDRVVVGNLYFRSDLIRQFYRGDTAAGMPAWTTNGNGGNDLNDSWAHPAPYLMWAGLEGVVWPYTGL